MVRARPGLGVTAVLDAHLEWARGAAGMRAWRVPVLASGTSTLSGGGLPEWGEPAVVVIDDLHRADDATLLALHLLADTLPGRAQLVVTGRRSGVTPARFARLDQLGLVHELAPLDERTVTEHWEGGEGARGNPWLLTRLNTPGRAAELTAWAAEVAGPDAGLLRWIALLDEAAAVDRLAVATEAAQQEVVAGIERLVAVGLVEAGPETVRLRYPLLRQALVDTSAGLGATAARRLARHGVADETVLDRLAGAPIDAWAVSWLLRRADRLTPRSTPAVLDVLARAVAWLPPGDPRRPRLVVALVEGRYWSGDRAGARRLATAQLTAALPAPLRQRLRSVLAKAALAETDPVAATAALEPERLDGQLPPRLAIVQAYADLQLGDLAAMERSATVATQVAAEDPAVAVALLNLRALMRVAAQDLAGAVELLDQADAMLDTAVYDRVEWLTSRLLRTVAQDLRFDPTAGDTVEQARPMAELIGGSWLPWLHTEAALIAYKAGRWEQALAEIDAAMALPDQYGMARPLHAVATMILLNRGDVAAGRARLERAELAVARGPAVFYEEVFAMARAALADREGRHRQALEIVRTIADGAVAGPGQAIGSASVVLVRIAVNSGDLNLARQLTETVRLQGTGGSPGLSSLLKYFEGLVDGDPELLRAAAHDLSDVGSLVAAAHADNQAALVLAASGRAADARAAHRLAVGRFTELAATGEIDRAGAALRAHGVRLGATGSRRRPDHGWAGLTAAERRVAELVARGLTDREIAGRLVVSVRTVHSHVSRVLAKLGCSSRVEVVLAFSRAVDLGAGKPR
jgi:DNA-binding CsgD family transcriptional regulator/tetratricopeptide (TPR) repeat protein